MQRLLRLLLLRRLVGEPASKHLYRTDATQIHQKGDKHQEGLLLCCQHHQVQLLSQLYNRICRVFLYMASRKEYKNSFVFLGLACFDISYPLHALLFTIGFYTAMFLQHSEVYSGLKIGKSSLGNILVGPVIFHVAPNKLSSCNCRHEGELPCKNRTCDNGGQQPCVCSRRFFVCTLHPKQVQTS